MSVLAFDFDGVVADTMCFLGGLAVSLLCEEYRMSRSDAQTAYRLTTGVSFRDQLERLFPGSPLNTLVCRRFRLLRDSRYESLPEVPGVQGVIGELVRRGYRCVTLSGTESHVVSGWLQVRGGKLASLLEVLCGDKSGELRRLGSSGPVVFIGDSLEDAVTAARAGARFVGYAGPGAVTRSEGFEALGLERVTRITDLLVVLP